MTAFRTAARAAAGLALVAVLAGCGKVATSDSVEDQIKSQLGADSADCPSELEGEVGRSIVCRATKDGETFDVKVTVTSVQGDTINFDIERVGGTPPAASAEPSTPVEPSAPAPATTDPSMPTVAGRNVAASVLKQLTDNGKQVEKVTCPDLIARVGAAERCTLVSRSQTYGVTVTVTSVQGTDVKFDIQVDQTPQ